MQIDLLTYSRTADESERNRLESDLRQKLLAARQYGGTPEEDRWLADVAEFLDRHFVEAGSAKDQNEDTLRGALAGLKKFVDWNIEQANSSLRQSERLDELGHRIGITVAVALLIGTAAIMVWLHAVAFRPVFEIRDAIKEFAGGQKQARAAIHGPEEFQSIAVQFNEMADALSRQHQNQAAFLAAIAHDLRNPITALKLSSDILSAPAVPNDELASLMAVIKRQVSSLDRMLSDLLDSAKIESGHLDLRFEELDGRLIAQDAFNLFRSASKAHQFSINLPDTPIPLHCDRLRIEQVLNNLLSNAIKYSPDGGGVELTLKASGEEGLFQISDQGMGIPEKDVQYIFEPFRRIRTAKEGIPGVGLGLSVAERIVRAHGGHIRVKTQIGKGTTFSVHLPLRPSLQATA
jgi:signal transduction histidine kinase